jgi:hypothetical protein
MIGLALGVLGAGLNTVQAIQAQKQMKLANQAATKAAEQLKNIKEFNPFKAVQVPTLGFDLAQQSQAQATTQAMQSLQGAGAEGVIGGASGILAESNKMAMELAGLAGQAQSQRDMAEAEAQQKINENEARRKTALETTRLEGAQSAAAAARENKNAAIQGIVGSLGSAALGAYEGSDLYKQNKYAKNANWTTDKVTNPYMSQFMSPIEQRP